MNIRIALMRVVDFVFAVVGTFLLLRFVLKLFGASDAAAFVNWVYEMTAVLLEPFRGVFPTTTFENQFVLEFSTLFALVAYGLAWMLITALITAVTPEPKRAAAPPA